MLAGANMPAGPKYVNAIGANAGEFNTGRHVNAFGLEAAYKNSGSSVNAFGNLAAWSNTGPAWVNAFGESAAYSNVGSNVDAMGYRAAYSNLGATVIAIGERAGEQNQATNCTFIGKNPDPSFLPTTSPNKFTVYGSDITRPILYGDRSFTNISLAVNTQTLSGNFNVSGSVFFANLPIGAGVAPAGLTGGGLWKDSLTNTIKYVT